MEEGEIILTVIGSDRKKKNRPVLVLKKAPRYNDFLVCGISSQLHEEVKGFDLVLDIKHRDYDASGLKHEGLVRLFFLGVIREEESLGPIGNISKLTLSILQKRLADYLIK